MNMQEDKSIIEVSHVSKYFGDKTALDDVTLNVKKGEFVTILGPSGCGKTTLLRLMAGFQTASEGEIRISGMEITQTPPHKRPVNTVFQKYALFPHLNVYDNIAFGLKLKKTPKQTIEKKVKAALKMVGMTDYEYRDVDSLSGGQQQRVAIARAIVNEPEVLLLDEPLAALDLKMRKDMQMELKEMHKSLGITFVYVTHDQEEALTLSDTIVVMSEGKIQQIGTPIDIYNEPINAFVADFIGESNILNGTMIHDKLVRFCGTEFECVDEGFGDADCPPDSFHSHAHPYKQDGKRNTHIVATDADNGRGYCAADAVENSLHGDFEHHKELGISVDTKEYTSGLISSLFGHEYGENFVSEENE